ncbi:MAG: hypothetical protein AB7I19_16750 [Planctomycetota bacterium]
MSSRRFDLVSLGPIYALASFGVIAHAFLLAGAAVPSWIWLPSIAAALGLSTLRVRQVDEPTERSSLGAESAATRLETVLGVVLLAATFAALTYGAIATPAREWDGFVSWELRARVLAESLTLDQDFFRDPAVFGHTREYPPLQPLVLASIARLSGSFAAARLFFPILWLAWLALLERGFRAARVPSRWRGFGMCAAGLTPVLVDPTMGAVDSGFGELLCLFAWSGAAVGLLTRHGPLTVAALALTILAKPEGIFLSGIFLLTAWVSGNRHALGSALLGAGGAALLWFPVYTQLTSTTPTSPWLLVAVVAAASIALLASATWLHRRGTSPAARMGLVAAAIAALVACAGFLADSLGSQGGVLGLYLSGMDRAVARLDRLGEIGLAMLSTSLAPRHLGLLVAIGFALVVFAWRDAVYPDLRRLVMLGFVGLLAPFLLSPEPDLRHHVSSSLDRLLLQQSGAAWLLVLPWLYRATRPPAQPAGLVAGSTR